MRSSEVPTEFNQGMVAEEKAEFEQLLKKYKEL